jgi:hypothetical protein
VIKPYIELAKCQPGRERVVWPNQVSRVHQKWVMVRRKSWKWLVDWLALVESRLTQLASARATCLRRMKFNLGVDSRGSDGSQP